MLVTREEYIEMGSNACRRKFKDWRPQDGDDVVLTKGKGRMREDDEDDERMPNKKTTRGRGRGAASAGPRRRGRAVP